MNEKRRPTLEDVAAAAGVSRATVSRVINGVRNVDPTLHEIVWAAVDQTGYVPNRAARFLVTRRSGTVALVVSDAVTHDDDPFMRRFFADPVFGRVVGGVMSVLRPKGIQLALQIVGTDDARARLVGDLGQGQADGAVVLSLHADDVLPQLLCDAGVAAALIGRPASPVPISYVDVANDAGGALAAERLMVAGCQRPAMITGPSHVPASQDRLTGFRQALARHGHAWFPAIEGGFTYRSGEAAARELLEVQPDTDGVFVANDLMAQGALAIFKHLGMAIPGTMRVIGFDDSSAALDSRPALTTIRHPLEDMAAKAATLVLERVNEPALRVESVIFDPELVIRESG